LLPLFNNSVIAHSKNVWEKALTSCVSVLSHDSKSPQTHSYGADTFLLLLELARTNGERRSSCNSTATSYGKTEKAYDLETNLVK